MATDSPKANWGKMLSLFSGAQKQEPDQQPEADVGTFAAKGDSDDEVSEGFSALDYALKKAIKQRGQGRFGLAEQQSFLEFFKKNVIDGGRDEAEEFSMSVFQEAECVQLLKEIALRHSPVAIEEFQQRNQQNGGRQLGQGKADELSIRPLPAGSLNERSMRVEKVFLKAVASLDWIFEQRPADARLLHLTRGELELLGLAELIKSEDEAKQQLGFRVALAVVQTHPHLVVSDFISDQRTRDIFYQKQMTNLAENLSRMQQKMAGKQIQQSAGQRVRDNSQDEHQEKTEPDFMGTLSLFDSKERGHREKVKVVNNDLPLGLAQPKINEELNRKIKVIMQVTTKNGQQMQSAYDTMIERIQEMEKIFLGGKQGASGDFSGQIQKYTAVQNQKMTQLECELQELVEKKVTESSQRLGKAQDDAIEAAFTQGMRFQKTEERQLMFESHDLEEFRKVTQQRITFLQTMMEELKGKTAASLEAMQIDIGNRAEDKYIDLGRQLNQLQKQVFQQGKSPLRLGRLSEVDKQPCGNGRCGCKRLEVDIEELKQLYRQLGQTVGLLPGDLAAKEGRDLKASGSDQRSVQSSAQADAKAADARARVSSAVVDHAPEKHAGNPTDPGFNLETSMSRHKRRKEQNKLDPEAMALLGLSSQGRMAAKASPETTSAKSEPPSLDSRSAAQSGKNDGTPTTETDPGIQGVRRQVSTLKTDSSMR